MYSGTSLNGHLHNYNRQEFADYYNKTIQHVRDTSIITDKKHLPNLSVIERLYSRYMYNDQLDCVHWYNAVYIGIMVS